ncbi:transglutaminase family protein [Pseudoruegeria sp. SK021]|uniref:transglutaminase family protein n=1 Tax=Pseudoruegeria sp. SK021 TaxID=1933035 RepID=UPI000A233819|nr:transglutaminase family protein [Pseudoruegeria sp. SK021]OSP56561.1 transglutaminase [Pseudoruegeria sp. SK021]
MQYKVRLTVTHNYPGSARSGRHLIRLFPANLPGRQTVLSRRLSVDPQPVEQREFDDYFQNFTTLLVHDTPHDTMAITAHARVNCLRVDDPGLNIAPPLSALPYELDRVQKLEARSPHHYLGKSPRIVPDRTIAAYAASQVNAQMTTVDIVRAIGSAIHRDMTFDPLATEVDTSAREAFALRRGVCQDFTHIMITGLRALGIPAGYVSGYLRTRPPEGQARLEGADAMHAWVQAWCGFETGWMEYDPTNAVEPAQDHIVVAYGRDYSDISPVKGVLRTAGPHQYSQAVDVVPVDEGA